MMYSNPIILASASPARSKILAAAGVQFSIESAQVDESAMRESLKGSDAADIALALAQRKAEVVSKNNPGAVVIGADQVLHLDGGMFGKPETRSAAHDQLVALRGRTHQLLTAVCAALDGGVLWRHVTQAHLTMQDFSDEFLQAYLDQTGDALHSPGAYHLEGLGATLFADVNGDHFSIQGLPLLPLLEFLRNHGVIGA